MTTLVVTSVGRRNYVLEGLVRAMGHEDVLIAVDQSHWAPGLSVNGVEPVVISSSSLVERVDSILHLVKRVGADALISLHDFEVAELSKHANDLADQGCLLIGPSSEAAQTMLSKSQMHNFLKDVCGLATPIWTTTRNDLLQKVKIHQGPWLVKDDQGSGSSGLHQFDDFMPLVDFIDHRTLKEGRWIALELIQGVEYNVDVFNDAGCRPIAFACKRKISMRGGETDAAIVESQPPEMIVEAAIRVAESIEVLGNIDIDIILSHERVPYVIDVNPRFGGGYAFSLCAGYDASRAVWQIAKRQVAQPFSVLRDFAGAKSVNVCQLNLRSFLDI